jgi:hypothetical protein
MNVHDGKSILNLPYQSRQIIVVANDALVETTGRRRPGNAKTQQSLGAAEVVASILDHVTPGAKLGFVLTKRAVDAYVGWMQAEAGGLTVLQVSRSDAQEISFPIGHPRDGITYVGHPSTPNVYYAMADFHKAMFQQKLCEAVRLLMNLGASKIEVEHVSGWGESFSANLTVPLPSAVSVTGRASSHSKGQTRLLYKAEFSGTTNPAVPSGLVWYNHEPTWQAIAEGRLMHGLKNFSIDLKYADDFGINAGLAAKIQKTGLDVGGKFEDHQSTHWRISGRFAASRAQPHDLRERAPVVLMKGSPAASEGTSAQEKRAAPKKRVQAKSGSRTSDAERASE